MDQWQHLHKMLSPLLERKWDFRRILINVIEGSYAALAISSGRTACLPVFAAHLPL